MKTRDKLAHLSGALGQLISLLKADPKCQWTEKFEGDLNYCNRILSSEVLQEDVNALSKSVMDVFQGMGSFNDYSPSSYDPKTGRYSPLPGTEGFDETANRVFDLAVDLRTKS